MVYNLPTILIVDDDEAICSLVSEGLTEGGYTCNIASTGNEALSEFQHNHFELALLDIKLPDESGMELLKTFRILSPNTKIIMMTAIRDFDTAVYAMKLGASDYVVKPFTIDKLNAVIGTVLDSSKRHNSGNEAIPSINNIDNYAKIDNWSLRAINTIAYGVDAQVDYFDFHSKIVTEKTIDIARQLCLPPEEIEKWESGRNELYSKRNSYIKSIMSKLERNTATQMILGLTHSVYKFPNLNVKQDSGDVGYGTYDS
jgi:DNA-binding response OmpR family regulator